MTDLTRQRGPVPGSTKAISQRKAVSDGYDVASDAPPVKTGYPRGETGKVCVPGFTNHRSRKGK